MDKVKRYNKNKYLIGTRFGKLEVVDFLPEYGNKPTYICKCDCGNETIIVKDRLTLGHTKSCGCLRKTFRLNENKDTSFKVKLNAYKSDAKRRGHCFELSDEKFKEISQQDCYYCGSKPENVARYSFYQDPFIYNGIDRKDNNVGYIEENCVACCNICNKAKRDLKFEDFMNWIKRIIERNK